MSESPPVATSKRYWIFQLTLWGIYELMNLVYARAWGYSSSVMDSILLLNAVIMLLTTHGYHLLYRHHFYQLSIRSLSLQLVWLLPVSAVLVQLTQALLVFLLLPLFPAIQSQLISLNNSAGAFIGYSMNTCIMLTLWSLVYLLYAEWHKRRKTEQEFWHNEIRLREIELQFLHSQINSHFLFNALNNIRALILEDTTAARAALSDLATLFRGLMQSDSQLTVPLREEIAWVKGYLALEALQYEQRLHYDLEIDSALLDARIPPMLLQTLVENAIRHGIAQRRHGGKIHIRASQQSTQCWLLQVENPLAELPPVHEGNGIGLKNARERLGSAFGEQAVLTLDISDKVIATAELPL